MDFVKGNQALRFVGLIQTDTIWNNDHSRFTLKDSLLVGYPEIRDGSAMLVSSDSLIVMREPFRTEIMNGGIVLAFSTDAIKHGQKKIWLTALLVSSIIFGIGMLLGLWLSRNISMPVLALRKAAKRVGEGDLSPVELKRTKDEIGELTLAFKNMVADIKKLSDLTLVQEKEKQHLLASQNEALERQVEERTMELQRSLTDLQAAQSQLVQAEKMASLGELTAGIAHEIQNPLNFVNNFSELNVELTNELLEEANKGNTEEVKDLAETIRSNEEKITFHGKRADAIVRSMLQHSRLGNGKKEPTDINPMVDEYLRLAYHGMRAKDKSFNAKCETDLDPAVGRMEVVPQDIGRVLLNTINNAFQAMAEKKKMKADYEPAIKLSTKAVDKGIEIRVSDNGTGMPEKIVDKIFQPFFTTRPTGEGTGLGLSLSYDIITKGHQGEIKVETVEGEGTSFVIFIPVP
jgi:signal transduction histidine kinase